MKIVTMARRFGVYPCIYAGLKLSKGDAVVYLDSDLQDPPELIPELIKKWREEKADVVYTTRIKRKGEPFIKLFITHLAYRILHQATKDIKLPVDTGDFKLLSRRVVDLLLSLPEKDPYFRGLVTWVGFKQVQVFYERDSRFSGKSQVSLMSSGPIRCFISALFSFSFAPINLLFYIAGLMLLLALVVLISGLTLQHNLFLLGTSLFLMVSALQFLAFGILGIYIGRSYNQVKDRPEYIIESVIG